MSSTKRHQGLIRSAPVSHPTGAKANRVEAEFTSTRFTITPVGFVATLIEFVATLIEFVATLIGFVATSVGFVATSVEFAHIANALGMSHPWKICPSTRKKARPSG